MKETTLDAKVSEFAADHPNAIVCIMYHKSWRNSEKFEHVYYTVKDGQPARLPAHQTINTVLPRYTLDVERGCHWRDYTANDVYERWLVFSRVNESYLTDRKYGDVQDCCRDVAAKLNRYFKNARIAELRAEGKLR